MIRNIFLAGLSFVFLSCISIESKITLAADGSGTVEIVYTISSLAQEWDSRDTNNSPLPLPVNEADFRRSVNRATGLSLISYSSRTTTESTIITAVVGFRSLAALNELVSRQEVIFTLRQESGRNIFEQVVTQGTRTALDDRTKSFTEAFFGPYSLKFELTAPRTITRSTPGSISGNKASVNFPLAEVVESRDPVVWRVEWQ